MTASDTIANTLICPLCELISPTGTSKCDCGYDFVSKQLHCNEGQAFALSYRQRLRVGWFFVWRVYVFGFIFGRTGVVASMLHYDWKMGSLGLLVAIAFVVSGVYFLRFVLNAMLRENFTLFRIRLWRIAEPHIAPRVSMKETIKLGWLFVWRFSLLGMIAGGTVGTFTKVTSDTTSVAYQIIYWSGFLLAVFIGGPWACRDMLKREFRGFRLRAVRTAPVDMLATPSQG